MVVWWLLLLGSRQTSWLYRRYVEFDKHISYLVDILEVTENDCHKVTYNHTRKQISKLIIFWSGSGHQPMTCRPQNDLNIEILLWNYLMLFDSMSRLLKRIVNSLKLLIVVDLCRGKVG